MHGAAGLSLDRVDRDVTRIQQELGNLPYAVNIIHSPNEPAIEQRTTELLLRKGVTVVEASAFLGLTPMVVQYRLNGLTRGEDGYVHARNRIIAKISRAETARQFMSPAPDAMVQQLRAADIAVTVDPEHYPIGRFARLADPEGNPIELWEPPAT